MSNAAVSNPTGERNTPLGLIYDVPGDYEIGREKIREYARAVQDNHPVHHWPAAAAARGLPSLVAPSTFLTIVSWNAMRRLYDAYLSGYEGVLQSEQTFELYRPLFVGDRVRTTVQVVGFRTFGGNDFVTVRYTYRDQVDEIVCVSHSTVAGANDVGLPPEFDERVSAVIKFGSKFARGVANPDRTEFSWLAEPASYPMDSLFADFDAEPHTAKSFEELSVGDELPSQTRQLALGDLVNFAGVGGDFNPIHFDDELARMVGAPGVIAHGQLTMALGQSYVSEWLDDPTAVQSYKTRFAGYVPVSPTKAAQVTFSGKIRSLDADHRTATISLSATCEGRKVFGNAAVVARFR